MAIFVLVLNIPYTEKAEGGSLPKVLQAVADGRKLHIKGSRATFFDGKDNWTVFGWTQPVTNPTDRSSQWLINEAYEILLVAQPISDIEILPFVDPVPNTIKEKVISIRTRVGEHEPASIVLRAGKNDLERVDIEVTPLRRDSGNESVCPENIDLRLVKCWYQSGRNVFKGNSSGKVLVPELLLHDDDLVRVNHEQQLNLVRNYEMLEDALTLKPFSVDKKSNQQVWIDIFIPPGTLPGRYSGVVTFNILVSGTGHKERVRLDIDVAGPCNHTLPIEYALFYLGWLNSSNVLGARSKTEEQMFAEFLDMREHGLTNVALDHDYVVRSLPSWDFKKFDRVLRIFRKAGFTTNRLLYIDWRTRGIQSERAYREKLTSLVRLARKYGFSEVFVYNKDEARYEELIKGVSSFHVAKELGCKNFVACRRTDALLLDGLLDVALLPRDMPAGTDRTSVDLLINGGMDILLGTRASGWISSNEGHLRIENGVLKKEKGGVAYLGQEVAVRQGLEFLLKYTVKQGGGRGFALAKGGGSCVDRSISLPAERGTHSIRFTANQRRSLRFFFPKDMKLAVDDVSLQPAVPEKRVGVIPWAYGAPKAGEERPGTYRERYGLSLIRDGFKGTCNYAYQSGECWNDWGNDRWRPHVLAYPTRSKPIPTLQWEAFREAIDDIRQEACDSKSSMNGF
ncbi:MAG: hypothetical protein JW902_04000 [Syntrophaceae bacterium]|nr:hypothetical protein [Syntrophaceae bacterium]